MSPPSHLQCENKFGVFSLFSITTDIVELLGSKIDNSRFYWFLMLYTSNKMIDKLLLELAAACRVLQAVAAVTTVHSVTLTPQARIKE